MRDPGFERGLDLVLYAVTFVNLRFEKRQRLGGYGFVALFEVADLLLPLADFTRELEEALQMRVLACGGRLASDQFASQE